MRIAFLAVLSDDFAIVVRIVAKELLGIAVGIDVDLGQCIVNTWIGAAIMNACLEPWQEQFRSKHRRMVTNERCFSSRDEPISFLDFFDEFVNVEVSANGQNQLLDVVFAAVHVQEAANDHR